MSISVFPPELVRLIVENLYSERNTLYALTLTSRLFNAEATRLLYASMTDHDGTKHYKFLWRIRRNPELAKLVHVYCLPITQNTQRGSLGRMITRCLPLMVNLKELTVHKIVGQSHILPPHSFKPCSFQLERFTWIPYYTNGDDANRFLETQPELTHIYWGSYDVPETSQDAFPQLRSLGANAAVANAILHGQPITTFHYRLSQDSYHDHGINERVFAGHAGSVAALFQLDIPSFQFLSFDCNPPCLLKDFREVEIKFFRNVEVLCMQEAQRENLLDMGPYLIKFPCLKQFVVTPRIPITEERHESINAGVLQNFSENPTLKFVDILWENPRLYKRWISGVPQDHLIQLSEDWIIESHPERRFDP